MSTGKLTSIIDGEIDLRVEPKRDYVGASGIGNPCERSIWYDYHVGNTAPIEPRRQRTLDIGKALEGLVLDALDAAGFVVYRPSKDNNFLTCVDYQLPKFRGHADAALFMEDEDYLLEIKTAKDSSFKLFQKKGLRTWYPAYYSQVQAYMGMTGIHQAYVIAINKDTSELHDECVSFDEVHYESLRKKAKKIIELVEEPPEKISNSPLYFQCRICSHRKACHG